MLQRAEADWEKQLQEIEHKYQTLLSHLHDVVLIADDAGAIAFVSPNVQRWLGYTPAEIQALGQIQTFLGIIESDRFECNLEDKFGNRHRFEVEVKAVAIEGGTQLYCCRPLEAQVRHRDRYEALIQAQTAELARLNEQLQQALNDRRHVEESARFSQKFFNTIFENLPNIIFVKAAGDLRFISINRAAERLLGCQRDLILGKTDSELFPADLAEWFRNQDRQVLATQQPVECLEAVVLPQNSQKRWLYLRKLPLFDDFGHLVYILAIAEDVTERQQSAQALQDSETTTRALFDAIPDLMLRMKADGTYIACKPAKTFSTPLAPTEIIGKQPEAILPSRAARLTRHYLKLALATQEVQVYEYQLYERGRLRYYEARAVACGNDEVLKIVRDISDRVAAEQALQESENRFRAIFEQAAAGMTILTLEGRFFRINQKFSEITGYTHIELLAKSHFDITYPEDQPAYQTSTQALLSGELSTFSMESRYLHKEGTIVWVTLTLAVIRNDAGEAQYLIAAIQDISDRVFAEAALRDAYRILRDREQQYRTLTDRAPVGIFQVNAERAVTFVNPCWCEITGLEAQAALGDGWLQSLHPDDRDRALAESHKPPEERQENFEFRFQRPDGSIAWVVTNSSGLRDENGDYQGEIGTILDITERKASEVALKQQKELLETIFDHIPIMVVFYDAEGQLQLLNRETERVLGWSLAEAKQMDLLSECYPDPAERAAVRAFIQEASGKWQDMKTRNRQGKIIDTAWANIRLSNGNRFGIGQDISDRKRAEEHLQLQAEREKLIGAMQARIRQSLDIDTIINTTVEEVRNFLQCDRVLVYRFNPDWSGQIVAESVRATWRSLLGKSLHDPCFNNNLARRYQEGHIHYFDDIETIKNSPCYYQLLAPLELKANLVVPILQKEHLWGLLTAQHCRSPHQWQEAETKFLQQLAAQVGIAIQQSQLYEQLKKANRELHRLATIDGLTQVANRRCFDAYLQAEWRRMARTNQPLALILGDIDYFKRYNDTYGHQAGDSCLQQVAAALRDAVQRPADLVARYGGEEFAAILPNTDLAGALHLAETIRDRIAALQIPHQASPIHPYVTLSLGAVAVIPTPQRSPHELVEFADRALYQAKDEGRDRVVSFD